MNYEIKLTAELTQATFRIDELKAQLSTALAEKRDCQNQALVFEKEAADVVRLTRENAALLAKNKALVEAAQAIKEHLEICAEPRKCPEIKAAFDVVLDEALPVTREELADTLIEHSRTHAYWGMDTLTDHILKTFRVERR